jgi:hypothetical protein
MVQSLRTALDQTNADREAGRSADMLPPDPSSPVSPPSLLASWASNLVGAKPTASAAVPSQPVAGPCQMCVERALELVRGGGFS